MSRCVVILRRLDPSGGRIHRTFEDSAALALPPGGDAITVTGMLGNLVPVIAGNIVGGSVLVALTFWVIYLRGQPPAGDVPPP